MSHQALPSCTSRCVWWFGHTRPAPLRTHCSSSHYLFICYSYALLPGCLYQRAVSSCSAPGNAIQQVVCALSCRLSPAGTAATLVCARLLEEGVFRLLNNPCVSPLHRGDGAPGFHCGPARVSAWLRYSRCAPTCGTLLMYRAVAEGWRKRRTRSDFLPFPSSSCGQCCVAIGTAV